MIKINEEKLKEVAKDLYAGLKQTRFNGIVYYDYEDGDIWIDWVYGDSWTQYKKSSIIWIPLEMIIEFGDQTTHPGNFRKYIDYEKGLREAIENEVYIEKKYGGLK